MATKITPTPIRAVGWTSDFFALVDSDGFPVVAGQVVTDFRGEKHRVEGGRAPHKPESTGRVSVYRGRTTLVNEFYPSVFGLRWVKD